MLCIGFTCSALSQSGPLVYKKPRGMDSWVQPRQPLEFGDHLNTMGLVTDGDGTYLAIGYTNVISNLTQPYLRERFLVIFRSTDAGRTWPPIPMEDIEELATHFAFSDSSPETNTDLMLTAGPKLSYAEGVFTIRNAQHTYRSSDKGDSWSYEPTNPDAEIEQPPFYDRFNAPVHSAKGGTMLYSMKPTPTSQGGPVLAKSTDGGNNWQDIVIDEARGEYIYDVCEDGTLLINAALKADGNRTHRLAITGDGAILQDLGTNSVTLRFIHITPEGHWLAGTGDGLFISKEPVCGKQAQPEEEEEEEELEEGPCAGFKGPIIDPKPVTFNVGPDNIVDTEILLNRGDYVCIIMESSLDDDARIKQGGIEYEIDDITLKGNDCDNITGDDLYTSNWVFFFDEGNYFVAETAGNVTLHLGLDSDLDKVEMLIYKLTESQHLNRNCLNFCPDTEPFAIERKDDFHDKNERSWDQGGTGDDDAEECYHGGYEDYRAISVEVTGSQCVYNDGLLVNTDDNNFLGTFDYGYQRPESNKDYDRKLHFIWDVLPHIAYKQFKKSYQYLPTPSGNISESTNKDAPTESKEK